VIYLVYRMKLTPRAQHDMAAFWKWATAREEWFYRELPMVRSVRWYQSVIGGVYELENWAGFDDIEGFAAYRRKVGELRARPAWEKRRVTQGEWWEFIDTRMSTDTPLPGRSLSPAAAPARGSRARPRRRSRGSRTA
jgi:hypothetical protein